MEAGNERATAAIEVFSYRVAKYIGSYVAAMNGVLSLSKKICASNSSSLISSTHH